MNEFLKTMKITKKNLFHGTNRHIRRVNKVRRKAVGIAIPESLAVDNIPDRLSFFGTGDGMRNGEYNKATLGESSASVPQQLPAALSPEDAEKTGQPLHLKAILKALFSYLQHSSYPV